MSESFNLKTYQNLSELRIGLAERFQGDCSIPIHLRSGLAWCCTSDPPARSEKHLSYKLYRSRITLWREWRQLPYGEHVRLSHFIRFLALLHDLPKYLAGHGTPHDRRSQRRVATGFFNVLPLDEDHALRLALSWLRSNGIVER
jgi:hypothetical protein